MLAPGMDDADEWSAEPDDSFRTPKLESQGFTSLTTPTARASHADEDATPQQANYRPEQLLNGASLDHEDVSTLTRTLPRLNLETAIDAEADKRRNGQQEQQEHATGDDHHDNSDDDRGPETARPLAYSRGSSFSQISPDLHVLASFYRPEEHQLTVANMDGYFEPVSLSTPTLDHFIHEDTSVQWGGSVSSKDKGKGRSIEAFGWPGRAADTSDRPSRAILARQYSSGRGFGHRKTASDASQAVVEPGMTAANPSRRASWMSNAQAFASTPSFTHEPEAYHPDAELENYHPRASSSSSSVADSVGTAGEAPDSDYEDARSKSHSRQGSRRPSVSEVPVITKRLSSFAPIPSLKASPSQTDVSRQSLENGPRPTTNTERKVERQDTDGTIKGEALNRTGSSQSTGSSASGSSVDGPHSAPASRTASSNAATYSTPMSITNSESFEKHRKENESWIKKRKKTKPSPLDKVISKTRPRDLPPKEREEDVSEVISPSSFNC